LLARGGDGLIHLRGLMETNSAASMVLLRVEDPTPVELELRMAQKVIITPKLCLNAAEVYL